MPRLRVVSGLARRSATPTALLLAVLLVLVAVLFSPVGLLWIGQQPGYDWPLLGNVGQTYGAASAILAALALIGVVTSLTLQAREAKAAREQALRALHTDLMKMAIDDPRLLECWGPIEESTDLDWFRKHVYTNLIVSHWQLMWEVDVLTEPHLEVLADQFFQGAAGRRFWAEARGPRMKAEISRRARRFTAVVDRSYRSAVAAGPAADTLRQPISAATPAAAGPTDGRGVLFAAGVLLGGGVVLLGRRLARRHTDISGRRSTSA
ncbi:DUF6082 family protein [Micromonospora sp. NPDC050200]|uniref:DUF6082 family protein n=1 Tax=Micromonospora sp. NPDC050200 TaxID=3155664 RepID=UPI0034038506